MQRRRLKFAPLLLSLVIFVWGVSMPASATAVIYDPVDYFDGATISGDTKTVTYTFDGITPLHRLYHNGEYKGDNSVYDFTLNFGGNGETSIHTYLMGHVAWVDKPFTGGVIKISDIMPGAELTFSTRFRFNYSLVGVEGATENITLYAQWAFYAYDADGNFLSKEMQDVVNKSWIPSGSNGLTVDSSVSYTVSSDVSYILPFVLTKWTIADELTTTLMAYFEPFSMTADINMIYENSQTMEAIKGELGDVNDKLDDIQQEEETQTGLLEQIGDSIASIPQKIGDTITGLFVPSEGKLESAAGQADQMLDDHLGAVAQAGDYVSDLAGAFTQQTTQEVVTFPEVNLDLAGVPWTFGGWDVDVVPNGFEFFFDIVATVIDIVATLLFLNGLKNRFEKILDGGG